jgi:transposase-like protein
LTKWYDSETRKRVADLFDEGYGGKSVATRLALPDKRVERWLVQYRAVGREVFLGMGKTKRKYDYETKLAAVRDYLDSGMTRQEVMEKYGIASYTALNRWASAYREGGEEALRPKPKGRPPKDKAEKPEPTEQESLEARVRYLEAEVAYLKKLKALEAEKRRSGRNAR